MKRLDFLIVDLLEFRLCQTQFLDHIGSNLAIFLKSGTPEFLQGFIPLHLAGSDQGRKLRFSFIDPELSGQEISLEETRVDRFMVMAAIILPGQFLLQGFSGRFLIVFDIRQKHPRLWYLSVPK